VRRVIGVLRRERTDLLDQLLSAGPSHRIC
jgi:hypothetical protein